MKKILLFSVILSFSISPSDVFAQMPSTASDIEAPEEMLFMNIAPVAMITKSSKENYVPASVTTITEEQISMTPARNIYDLIEVYVPGALLVTHAESPHIGIRGIISDRNYKMILLINGRNLNQNAHSGPEAELEQWDLHDIKKIEIIREPGSVTYGPGAIECVINITTKNAMDTPGTRAGVQYVSKYDSKGAYFSEGWVKKDSNLYVYGSLVSTKGFSPKEYYVTPDNKTGYLGKSPDLGNLQPLDYFNDTQNYPQGKFYTEYNFAKEFKAWARFTNFGSSRHGSPNNLQAILDTGQTDLKENEDQVVVSALENNHEFSDDIHLDSMFSFSSMNHHRWDNPTATNIPADPTDRNGIKNIIQAFSETEVLWKSLLNYKMEEKYNFAGGVEYAYEHFGPGWGDAKDLFRMGDSSNIFGSANSAAIAGTPSPYVTSGWGEDRLSYLGEANLEFDPKFNLIISGRTDQSKFTKLTFSPRVAIVSDWQRMGITKFIWQKSTRMNTAEQLKLTDAAGQKNPSEKLTGFEFIYDVNATKKLDLTSSVFYNELGALGWSSASTSTVLLGTVKIIGTEVEGKYKATDKLNIGASQTYTKQLSFVLGSGQARSGISYADYNTTAGGLNYLGTGNDLNNWANWSTKFYADYNMNTKWTFHADARIFWKFEGYLDGLTMVENAAQGTPSQSAVDAAVNDIKNKNAFQTDARLNVSARYNFNKNVSATLFVLNLLGFNGNKIYSYDAGVNAAAPNRVSWIEEPRVVGAKVDCKF